MSPARRRVRCGIRGGESMRDQKAFGRPACFRTSLAVCRAGLSPFLMASLAAGHALPAGFQQDSDNVGVEIVRYGGSTITHKSAPGALGDHQFESAVRAHLDRDRTLDPKIVGEHFRGKGLDEFYELAKRIGFHDEPRNVARRNPDIRLRIPPGLNMKSLAHAHIMRARVRNGKPASPTSVPASRCPEGPAPAPAVSASPPPAPGARRPRRRRRPGRSGRRRRSVRSSGPA